MIYAFVSYIVSFVLFYFSTHYSLFVLAMILFSFGEAFRTGTHKAMIFEYLKIRGWRDQKVYYYGNTRSWAQVGSACSSLLAAFIVFYSGNYKFIFLYSTVPYLIGLILMMTYPKELDGETRQLEGRKIRENLKKVTKGFVHSFRNIDIARAIANSSVYAGFFRATRDYIQPILNTFALSLPVFLFLNDKERSSIVIGAVYFLIFTLTSIASKRSGQVADLFRRSHTPLNITLIVGFSLGLLSGFLYRLDLSILAIISYVGIYLVENIRKPMAISYVSDVIDQNVLATALSAESQARSLVAALVALAIGFFADRYGVGLSLVFVSSGLILTIPLYLAKEARRP